MQQTLVVIVEATGHGWLAYSPDVPECIGEALEPDEALIKFAEELRSRRDGFVNGGSGREAAKS